MSEEKFSKCEEGKKKNVSVEFRVFGKKMEIERKVPRERKKNEVRDFVLLLSSYPLVGRHVVNEPKVGCHVVNELEIF